MSISFKFSVNSHLYTKFNKLTLDWTENRFFPFFTENSNDSFDDSLCDFRLRTFTVPDNFQFIFLLFFIGAPKKNNCARILQKISPNFTQYYTSSSKKKKKIEIRFSREKVIVLFCLFFLKQMLKKLVGWTIFNWNKKILRFSGKTVNHFRRIFFLKFYWEFDEKPIMKIPHHFLGEKSLD